MARKKKFTAAEIRAAEIVLSGVKDKKDKRKRTKHQSNERLSTLIIFMIWGTVLVWVLKSCGI